VASFCNHLVNLCSRQLSALARLCALRNLNLNFVSVYEVVHRYAETPRCHLLNRAASRRAEASRFFTALACVAFSAYAVHCRCQRLVRLLADRAKRHCACYKPPHDCLYRLNLRKGYRVAPIVQPVAKKDGVRLIVDHCAVLLELFVAAQARCNLQQGDSLRVPCVFLALLAESVLSKVAEMLIPESCAVKPQDICRNILQVRSADGRGRTYEVFVYYLLG